MQLIGSGTSPFVRKVRVASLERGISLDFVVDPPWAGTAKVSEHNPLGKIPVLCRQQSSTLYDSSVIAEYIDSIGVGPKLIPDDIESRLQVRTIESLADGISDAVVLQVIETWRPVQNRSAYFHDRQGQKIDRALQHLDTQIAHRTWFIGNSMTIADISVGCALGMIGLWRSDLQWFERNTHLRQFWSSISERTSFSSTVPKIAPGSTFPRL